MEARDLLETTSVIGILMVSVGLQT